VIEVVAWHKSSLILPKILQYAQTLQLFKMELKKKIITKVIKMPSLGDRT
jgi:hypothetical protein